MMEHPKDDEESRPSDEDDAVAPAAEHADEDAAQTEDENVEPPRSLPRLGAGTNAGGRVRGPVHPINWNLLSSNDAEVEWLELNSWVSWLRLTYGLVPAVLPPFWHRHPELVWELSALHLHWLASYDPEQHASGPLTWHRDFMEAQTRLRFWVQACGTKIDRDRPTRQTSWPGEPAYPTIAEVIINNRDLDFVRFVIADVAARRAEEDAYYRRIAESEAEQTGDSETPTNAPQSAI